MLAVGSSSCLSCHGKLSSTPIFVSFNREQSRILSHGFLHPSTGHAILVIITPLKHWVMLFTFENCTRLVFPERSPGWWGVRLRASRQPLARSLESILEVFAPALLVFLSCLWFCSQGRAGSVKPLPLLFSERDGVDLVFNPLRMLDGLFQWNCLCPDIPFS